MTTIICMGTGPSLSADQVDATREHAVLAVNNAIEWTPWARWHYASDRGWWDTYHDRVRACYTGPSYTISGHAARRYGLTLIRSTGGPQFCRRPTHVSYGKNSGHSALNLAAHMGARRIILIGYDFQRTGGRSHCFGDHPDGMRNAADPESWLECMRELAPGLASAGIEVVNCTESTAIDCFKRDTLDRALRARP